MKSRVLFYLIILLSGCIVNRSDVAGDEYIFRIENHPVSKEEFVYNLKKNNYENDSSFTKEEIDEYLELYINFKLKVHEAEDLGMDTTQVFLEEFNKYKDQLTESYLKDDSVINSLAIQAYERMKTEISASHILVSVSDFSDPSDTLRAYRKIQRIYGKAKDGENFASLAIENSDDPSVRNNKGYLGYFSSLQMVYPFEEAAYNTPVGNISEPFRTRFGYHILKIHDKRPNAGEVQVAHIMIRTENNPVEKDSLKAVKLIHAIYDSLDQGGSWDYLCSQYSQDMNTKNSGGVIAPFSSGRIIPSFSEAAFSLQNPGDISDPVLTPYGWHIIKLIKKIPVKPYENLKNELLNKIKQDSRSEQTRKILIKRLKEENKYEEMDFVIEQIYQYADSSLIEGTWTYDTLDPFRDFVLFKIGVSQYTVDDFFAYVKNNQKNLSGSSPQYKMNQLFQNFTEEELIKYEKDHLADKYFEYKMLVNEYREGILLFELMNRKVWNRAVDDSVGLEKYYENNKDNYMWGPRISATIFKTDNSETIEEIRKLLGKSYYYLDTTAFVIKEWDQVNTSGNAVGEMLDSLYGLARDSEEVFVELGIANNLYPVDITSMLSENEYDTSQFIISRTDKTFTALRLVSVSKKDLNRLNNNNSIVNLQIITGSFEKGENDIIDLVDWEPGIHDLSIENDEYLVYVDKLLPPENKKLSEARGEVISDYQDDLEKSWIRELKAKYTVDINTSVLKDIYREFETF